MAAVVDSLLDTLRRHGAAPVVLHGPVTPDVWAHHRAHGGCDRVPPHLRRVVSQLDRYFEAADSIRHPLPRHERARIEAEVYADLEDRAARRVAEQALADYIRNVAEAEPGAAHLYGLDELAESLETCRTSGVAGQTVDGALRIAWDHKCGQVRLCPDESRTETQRVAERYVTAMKRWHQERPGRRRIIYAVFTCPNFEPGRLAHGKRFTLARFRDWMRHEYAACPVTWRTWAEDNGDGTRTIRRAPIRTRKRKIPALPAIKGAMVIQEDPLSARDDWNVHLNAFLLIEGRFDYAEARALWGWNVEFRELDASEPGALSRAALEAVKYSAQIVPTKSAEKRARHGSDAPAMVEWPAARWVEWWGAGKGFRRLRSYGALYRLEREEQTDEPALVRWLGRVSWDAGSYRVDLIPENNFYPSGLEKWSSPAAARTGPPAWH